MDDVTGTEATGVAPPAPPTEAGTPPPGGVVEGSAEGRSPRPTAQEKPVPGSSGPAGFRGMVMGTGRRKTSIARVRLVPGNGAILVNRQPYEMYFPRETLRLSVRAPLLLTHQLGKCNVIANVEGGGIGGQAGAVRLGIARALVQLDAAYRPGLRGAGLLTRDPRERERKKYGRKGARKRFQWTKR